MTGFIVSVFPFRNRVSSTEAFEGLELGEGKLSRPVLRGPGGRKAAWLLGSYPPSSLPNASRIGPGKSSPKKVAAKSFILQGDADPLSSAPVWAEPSQLLIGMWLSGPLWPWATFR